MFGRKPGSFLLALPAILAVHAATATAQADALPLAAGVPPARSTRILGRPPLQLGWSSPEKDVWINGESPEPERDALGRIIAASGSGVMGARQPLFQHGPLSLTAIPQFRAEAGWVEKDGPLRQAFGGAVFEELALTLPEGLRFHAKGGIGDRTGLSLSNPGGAFTGFAIQGEAGLSGHLAPETRFDMQVVASQAFGATEGEEKAPGSCELKLSLTRKGMAPLSIGTSCPGAGGADWVSLHISGRF